MRVMVIVKASAESEAGVLPSTEMLGQMGKFNEELAKAGVMLAGEGLQSSSEGKRVRFDGNASLYGLYNTDSSATHFWIATDQSYTLSASWTAVPV